MRVAFITGPRKGISYIAGSVERALAQGMGLRPHDVAVFTDEATRPDGIPEAVRCFTRDQSYIAEPMPALRRITHNYVRALQWATFDRQGYGCVCEDDVDFARNWYRSAIALADQASSRTPSFALTLIHLYQPSDFAPVHPGDRFSLMRWPDPSSFYMQQGVVYASEAGHTMAHEWRRMLDSVRGAPWDEQGKWYVDMGLKHMVLRLRLPLYVSQPCLVQHVGDEASVLGRTQVLRAKWFTRE